ncbi:uncharacterized protein CLUP02_09083 [Colletotrichum lupini]|uniref:Uncharacterized protein n=1 Tax=Colletotrichum lupini TaxID=145971 RepID=A0A9Q8WHH7_9PEZI|nr:uncharacterized protein CLUP02_09083 [Colletotrichum lupini]UQC83589.1 hypothetical protein CLUP02_09083 [Colletotrichum lupini]
MYCGNPLVMQNDGVKQWSLSLSVSVPLLLPTNLQDRASDHGVVVGWPRTIYMGFRRMSRYHEAKKGPNRSLVGADVLAAVVAGPWKLTTKAKQVQCKTPLSDLELLRYHSSEDYPKLDYHFVSSVLPKCLKVVDNTATIDPARACFALVLLLALDERRRSACFFFSGLFKVQKAKLRLSPADGVSLSPMVDVGVRGCVKVRVAVSEDEKKQLYQENTKPKPHWPQHHELMNEPYTGRIRVRLVSRYHVTSDDGDDIGHQQQGVLPSISVPPVVGKNESRHDDRASMISKRTQARPPLPPVLLLGSSPVSLRASSHTPSPVAAVPLPFPLTYHITPTDPPHSASPSTRHSGNTPFNPSLYRITDVSLKHHQTSSVIESDEIIITAGFVGRVLRYQRRHAYQRLTTNVEKQTLFNISCYSAVCCLGLSVSLRESTGRHIIGISSITSQRRQHGVKVESRSDLECELSCAKYDTAGRSGHAALVNPRCLEVLPVKLFVNVSFMLATIDARVTSYACGIQYNEISHSIVHNVIVREDQNIQSTKRRGNVCIENETPAESGNTVPFQSNTSKIHLHEIAVYRHPQLPPSEDILQLFSVPPEQKRVINEQRQ